jgi:hypothetical protein
VAIWELNQSARRGAAAYERQAALLQYWHYQAR